MKSSFAKHITAFVVIIFVSFLALSGIITSILRNYVSDEREQKLELAGSIIVEQIANDIGSDISLENYVKTQNLSMFIVPIVSFDTNYDVVVTDKVGTVLLSTLGAGDNHADYTEGELGAVDLDLFSTEEEDGTEIYRHEGTLDGFTEDNSLVLAKEIEVDGVTYGYVLTIGSTAREDKLISISRQAVINSSGWVMLAAVIAVYFITEKIVHPLKAMTGAAKKFAKGDFSARVTVYGKDEVAELANAFNNMAQSLDSLEKMRNSFLANISHDLRTPMTTISGFIDGITSGAIPPEKHEYYLGVISAEVHRLSRLVSQILDVSRLESGERKFNFTDFDVAEVARIILISFEQKIEDKHLDVSFDTDSDEMIAIGDKDAIYQVLYNLCHNAIKFSREGGKFSIKLSRTQGKKICVSVFDEGQSISPEDEKLVFDRFYKTDKSRGLDKSGVGLGLYISKTIIDAHGENIWVESKENESTEFFFTLKEGMSAPKRRQSPRESAQ